MSDNTRAAIITAFSDIMLEGGYDNCRVLDIVARSGVARSTFYEHFESREDVLRELLAVPFTWIAHLASASCDINAVTATLEHIAENRTLLRSLMQNPGLEALISIHAAVLQEHAKVREPAARALAAAHLATLSQWLEGNDRRSAGDVAVFLRTVSVSLCTL